MDEPVKRDDNGGRDPVTGQFGAGNPGGGRRKMTPEVRAILEAATEDAARVLVDGLKAMQYVGMAGRPEPNWKERREYAIALYERLYGKPAQAVTDADGGPLRMGLIFLPPTKPDDAG